MDGIKVSWSKGTRLGITRSSWLILFSLAKKKTDLKPLLGPRQVLTDRTKIGILFTESMSSVFNNSVSYVDTAAHRFRL